MGKNSNFGQLSRITTRPSRCSEIVRCFMYDYPLFTAGNFIADYSTLEFYSLFKSPAEQSCAEIIVTGIAFCEKIKLVSKNYAHHVPTLEFLWFVSNSIYRESNLTHYHKSSKIYLIYTFQLSFYQGRIFL